MLEPIRALIEKKVEEAFLAGMAEGIYADHLTFMDYDFPREDMTGVYLLKRGHGTVADAFLSNSPAHNRLEAVKHYIQEHGYANYYKAKRIALCGL